MINPSYLIRLCSHKDSSIFSIIVWYSPDVDENVNVGCFLVGQVMVNS